MKKELVIDVNKFEDARVALLAAFEHEDAATSEVSVSKLVQSHIYGTTREAVAADLGIDAATNDAAKKTLEALGDNKRLTKQLVSDLWIVYRVGKPSADGSTESGLGFSAILTLSKSAKLGDALKNGDADAVKVALDAAAKTDGSVKAIRDLYKAADNDAAERKPTKAEVEKAEVLSKSFVALFDALDASADTRDALATFAAAVGITTVFENAVKTERARLEKAANDAAAKVEDIKKAAAELSDDAAALDAAVIALDDAVKAAEKAAKAADKAAEKAVKVVEEAAKVGGDFERLAKADAAAKVDAAKAAHDVVITTVKKRDAAAEKAAAARAKVDAAALDIKAAEKAAARAKSRITAA